MEWLTALWTALVNYWPTVGMAAVVPYLVALIARTDWSPTAKGDLMVALSVAVGVLGAFIAGITLTPETVIVFAAFVWATAKIVYRLSKDYGITCRWLEDLLQVGSGLPAKK